MRLHRFYTPAELQLESFVVIEEKMLLHQWMRVFRLRTGNEIILFNGDGNDYISTIETLSEKRAVVVPTKKTPSPKLKKDTWLFVSLIKKDKLEWVVEKGTELGIKHFVPIISERSEKKLFNMERLQKIAVEASEQCGRGDIPLIHELVAIEKATTIGPKEKICFDFSGTPLKNTANTGQLGLFIGPEGGFTPKELEFFKKNKIQISSLGILTMRAETAAIAASALVNL